MSKLKDLSQEEFAKELKITRKTISAIENCKYNPPLDLAFKLAIYFDKTIEDIFIYENGENYEKN